MGSVWLAEHLLLGSEVAVKLLSPELASNPEALERFRREATAVAQLKSPHVVAIHDFGDADGVPYFVMEHLTGEDLGQRLDRATRLPIGTATAIVAQTCKALARVHELGIVHRDLKPGNIFLTTVDGDLVVKLLDFGVAKTRTQGGVSKHQTSDEAVLGTPLYMSPEQFLSPRSVGPASDLYSLAVVIYECLAGEPPFDGETAGALHVAIANGRYKPITGIDPSLPLALDGWFARAFAPSPADRFSSAREMSDAFLEAARGRHGASSHASIAAIPVTASIPVSMTVGASSPRPSKLAAAVAIVALVLGGALAAASASASSTSAASKAAPRSAEETRTPLEPSAVLSIAEPSAESEAPAASSSGGASSAAPAASASPPRVLPSPGKPHRKNRGF